ncbi:sialate O-acetylesterase [Marilutibacter alkalisoli]|uniref:9-O-acetylesterase n=1 Tax=Marilutibacter alkalisoli TaxID=2591633 RepID=A0A514BV17_9GAMM|nr:sialate O-acetylesterase [Lysobacter alkalisoli]QDH71244.1 9-O-acetylesterase [Lysobacter alkalisoli]
MTRFRFVRVALLLAAGLAATVAHAVELPRIFADGMVLQRGQPIQVWGRAGAGARIEVTLDGDRVRARADADGAWRVELPAREAGGPFTLRIDDGRAARELRDVLVGDVWLASGQSNMEWPISQSADAEAEIARATDPLIRHFKVPKSWSGEPQWQLAGGDWVASSPDVAGQFSAVAHFFARELRDSTGVPIGIVDSSWGGSRIEAWMDAPALGLDPAAAAMAARRAREADERALQETRRRLSAWSDAADDSGWEAADFDASDWVAIPVPGLWESNGWVGLDGVAWYRTTFTLDAAEAKAGVLLGVGRVDDSDVTYVNGQRVGATTQQYNLVREYAVPASALRAGVNQIAVRVTDTGGGGGIHGAGSELFVQPVGGTRRALDGAWTFRVANAVVSAVDDNKNQFGTLLYNAMIHPLQPYGIRGVIWYQGESNAAPVEQAMRYRELFPALIGQWRAQWQAPALPFLWVQLAAFGTAADTVADGVVQASPWAVLRESQSATLSLPATAQVVAIDVGDVADIHPRNKQDVGKRLALAARHVAYGESLVHTGPVFAGARFENGAATVVFEADSGPLAARGGGDAVQGFVLAGADGVFHAADAVLDGDRVIVRSRRVAKPVAVRYAWSDNPASADLVNEAGLPASPFRSDDW